jgi:lipoyl-dependent peroxiredoxin
MANAKSRAEVVWQGDLMSGSGTVTPGSQSFSTLPVSWATRTERQSNKTSPEELIASAHASCFAMAFSNTLAKAGHPPKQLNISAVCTFDFGGEGGSKITTMELTVRGQVPGIDQAEFQRLAQEGEKGCPVSNALRNNVQISVEAQLEQG